jgi:Uma2 family endonuclease
MPNTAKRKAVYEDLYDLPENMTGEIIEGEIHAFPRPHYRHGRVAYRLNVRIGAPYDLGDGGGPGGWVFVVEPEVMLGENLLVPDVAGWQLERLPKLPQKNWSTVPPDWVCEILSPNTRGHDRIKKMPIYGQYGVKHAWLIDPVERTLEVFQLDGGRWVAIGFYGGKDIVRAEPFVEAEINLGDFWMEEEGGGEKGEG